jgi:simple sugar transport system permease protein
MIVVLALTSSGALERLGAALPEPLRRILLRAAPGAPPAALGKSAPPDSTTTKT